MIDRILTLLAPHSCCGCGYHGALLCLDCKYDIISEPFAVCLICLKPSAHDNLCNRCQANSLYEAAWAMGVRGGALKGLLDTYKFNSSRQASRDLLEILDDRLPLLPVGTAIVPVPTSPSHRRIRGFDHIELFAKPFAKRRGHAYTEVLMRHDSGTQHFLGRADRIKAAQKGLSLRTIVPETILLVDDIFTTGATLDACARMLRANGAKTIFVAVIARQVLDEDADLW